MKFNKNLNCHKDGFIQHQFFTYLNYLKDGVVITTNRRCHSRQAKTGAGFTLIEILVVIGMIAILATIVIIAINPSRQFASGRNTQRTSNVNAILNAIGQNIADNHGNFVCSTATVTSVPTDMTSSSTVNVMPCLVPTYMPSVLADPQSNVVNSTSSYDTMYYISKDSNNRYTIAATSTELGGVLISATR